MDSKGANDQLEPFFELLLRDIAKGDFESYAKATHILGKWLNSNPETHYPAVKVEVCMTYPLISSTYWGEPDNQVIVCKIIFAWTRRSSYTFPEVTQARAREEVNFRHGFDVTFKALQYQENRFVREYIKLVSAVKPFEGIFATEVKGLKGMPSVSSRLLGCLHLNQTL